MANKMCVNCAAEFPGMFCLWSMEGCRAQIEITGEAEDPFELTLEEDPTEKVMKDPVSTGRKRAAVLYPIAGGQVCEWALRKNAGGGIDPIIGCAGRPASHIHHGPDKSTLNNDRTNISLVCEFCHNRWHVANDKYYGKRPEDNSTWIPHVNIIGREIQPLSNIVKASKMEILTNEMLIPEGGKDAK
jgi:hypothetical protein